MPSGYVGPPPPLKSKILRRPGLALRMRVWQHASELDALLAGGADPTESRELALRAEQLADPSTRRRFADAIDNVLTLADGSAYRHFVPGSVPFRPAYINANRSLLRELSGRLRGPGPHPLRGVAMAAQLVEESGRPLYRHQSATALERTLRATLSALETEDQSSPSLAA
jgi:hypothetical protein